MSRPSAQVVVGADAEATVATAARRITTLLGEAVSTRGRAAMALAGGSTPRRLYQVLATPPTADTVPWPDVDLFLGDERCVAADHPDANQRMVRESLLAGLPSPPRFHPMVADRPDLAAAAADYAALLAREVPATASGVPRLDLVLLGVGPDGHTASLFPGTPILADHRPVAEVWVPRLDAWRMSLTLPVLNAARRVIFLVTGSAKADMVMRLVEGAPDPALPASLVAPSDGAVEWHLDREAAARLAHPPAP